MRLETASLTQRPTRISSGCMASSRTSTQPLSRGFQIREKIGGALSVGRHDTFEEPRQIFRTEIFALLLAIDIKSITRRAAGLPLHLFAHFFE